MSVKQAQGFTLIELTLAMTLATILMFLMSQGIIRLYRTYESGIAIRSTQHTARSLTQVIDSDARDTAAVAVGAGHVCLFSNQNLNSTYDGFDYYTAPRSYQINGVTPIDIYKHVFQSQAVTPNAAGCAAITDNPGGDQRLNGDDVSVLVFQPQVPSPQLLTVHFSIAASSALDVVNMGTLPPTCNPVAGMEYCSITNIETSVMTRAHP